MSANTQAITTSFLLGLLEGVHNFGTGVVRSTTAADTFKGALYVPDSSLGATTTAYSATGEVSSSGYTAGGLDLTNATAPTTSGTTAYWTPSANLSWSGVTFTTDSLLVYNSTQSNASVAVLTFGSQSVTSGTFTLTMPTNGATTALIQVAA